MMIMLKNRETHLNLKTEWRQRLIKILIKNRSVLLIYFIKVKKIQVHESVTVF